MLSCIFGRCSSETYVVNKVPRTGSGTNGVIISHIDPDQTIVEVEERSNNQQVNTQEQVRTPQSTQNGHVIQVPEGPSHSETTRNTPQSSTSEQESRTSKYDGESTIDEEKGQSSKPENKSTISEKKEQGRKPEDKNTISEKKGQGSTPEDKNTISEKKGEGSKPEDKSTVSEKNEQSSKYEDKSATSEKRDKSSKYEDKSTTSEKREQSNKSNVTPTVKEPETQAKSKVKAPQPPRQTSGVSHTSDSSSRVEQSQGSSVKNDERRGIHQIEEANEGKFDDNEQEEDSSKVRKRRSGILPLPVKYDETAPIKFKASPKNEK